MPVRATPEQATQRWVNGLGSSTQKIQDGVNRVTVAPGQKAAAAQAKWFARLQASQQKWATRVAAVTLQEWQQAMSTVGVQRVAQGAQAKQGKFQAFMADFLPYLQAGVSRVEAMPSVSLEDNINRSVAMIRYNAQYRRGGSTGVGA